VKSFLTIREFFRLQTLVLRLSHLPRSSCYGRWDCNQESFYLVWMT